MAHHRTLSAILLAAICASASAQAPVGSAWIYQGRLTDAGAAANGIYDFEFRLFDAAVGGLQVGATLNRFNVGVTDGLYTTDPALDFGPGAFDGQARWLQISVKRDAAGAFTTLPRQVVSPTPYAIGLSLPFSGVANIAGPTFSVANNTGAALLADGLVNVGGANAGGLRVETDPGSDSRLVLNNSPARGANLDMYSENNFLQMGFEADVDGSGGFLFAYRDDGAIGFFVDGNRNGTEEPGLFLQGSAQSASINLSQAGNASVQFPSNAIAAAEILDEPGVANDANNSVGTAIGAALTTVASRSITVPAPGYVLVIGTIESLHSHTNGTETNISFGVSDSNAALPGTQDMGTRLSANLPTGTFLLTNSSHSVFPVNAPGTFTYYLLAQMFAGNGSAFDSELTLLYIPSAYGTVELFDDGGPANPFENNEGASLVGGGRPGLSAQDIARERAASEAFNLQRIRREMDEMRARLEQLERDNAHNQPAARR